MRTRLAHAALATAALLFLSGVAHAEGPTYKVRTSTGEVRYATTICDQCVLLAVVASSSSSPTKRRTRSAPSRERAHQPPSSTRPHPRSSRYDRHIRAASKRFGVPAPFIKAVIHVESRFQPDAVSPVGAQGLMQLMPATAKELGVSDPFDPRQNIFGGTKYLARLTKKYNGDINDILAGYNAGPGRVDQYGGIPYRATRGYVIDVMHWYGVYRQSD
jgi:soluble lytic murein transglycosylase-like protein